MGKINGCLKAVFIFFNALFSIIGCLLIYGLLKTIGVEQQMGTVDAPSMVWVWVFAISLLGISLLGSLAACTESKACLKVFAGFMVIAMVLMLICGIAVAFFKSKAKEIFESAEVTQEVMKHYQAELKSLQEHLQCCGWTGVEDWDSDIPSSCSCYASYGHQDECKPAPSPCRDVAWYYVELLLKITLCILFGFFFIALMGLIIAIKMINQIRRHDSFGGTVMAMRAY